MAVGLLGLGFFLVLNFAISWWNAYAVGRTWKEANAAGGWPMFVNWSAAVMSASGFTWVYLTLTIIAASFIGVPVWAEGEPTVWMKLPPEYVQATADLGFLFLVLPMFGSGLVLWVESLIRAWKERSLASGGVAAWNTFAQIHNTVIIAREAPLSFGRLAGLFSSDDAKTGLLIVVVLLVLMAIIGGILTTYLIMTATISKTAVEQKREYDRRRRQAEAENRQQTQT